MEFEIGDLVQLKVGSPTMPVAYIDDRLVQSVHCVWFICNKYIRQWFAPEVLEHGLAESSTHGPETVIPPRTPLHLGDSVALRSGGPRMIVEYFRPDDMDDVNCVWLDDGKPCSGSFALVTLTAPTIKNTLGECLMDIRLGDKVRLKGSTTVMVVEAMSSNGVACIWNDGTRPFRQYYEMHTLE